MEIRKIIATSETQLRELNNNSADLKLKLKLTINSRYIHKIDDERDEREKVPLQTESYSSLKSADEQLGERRTKRQDVELGVKICGNWKP